MKFESPNPSNNEKQGNNFLKRRFDLHKTGEVTRATKKTERLSEEGKVPQSPEYTIQAYLDRLNGVLYPDNEEQKVRNLEMLKNILHEKFIIKEDQIPDSYWKLQRQIYRDRGESFPDKISNELRHEAYEILARDQIESLDQWVDYLSSDDAKDAYPDWAKIWVFKSILKMSDYDKKNQSFGKRSLNTTGPYPDLNQEALATAIEYISNIVEGKEIDNPVQLPEDNPFVREGKPVSDKDFEKILSTENFGKFYAFAIEYVVADTSELWKNTEGEWIKYDQGSEEQTLTKTLQGKGTGWCTAGTHTAKKQLSRGDFYVYYSKNGLGEYKIPRLAIRMNGNSIAEVRGVAHKQEMDPYISPVLESKMDEFGKEGEYYKKKAEGMKRLTDIDNRVKDGFELAKEDLIFLYEIENKIEGFGYKRDPRIDEIKNGRRIKEDLIVIFGVMDDQDLASKIIDLSGTDCLAKELQTFGDRSLSPEIAHKLIKDNQTRALAENFIKFNISDYSKFYNEIIDDNDKNRKEVLVKLYEVSDNDKKHKALLDTFEVVPEHSLKQELAIRLIRMGFADKLASKIDKFLITDFQQLANEFVEAHRAHNVFDWKMRDFRLSNPQEIVDQIIDRKVDIFSLCQGIDRPDFKDLNHTDIAKAVIKAGGSESLIYWNNIKRFSEINHQEIAMAMIDAGRGSLVVNNINHLKNIDKTAIALKLLEVGKKGFYDFYPEMDYFKDIDEQIYSDLKNTFYTPDPR